MDIGLLLIVIVMAIPVTVVLYVVYLWLSMRNTDKKTMDDYKKSEALKKTRADFIKKIEDKKKEKK